MVQKYHYQFVEMTQQSTALSATKILVLQCLSNQDFFNFVIQLYITIDFMDFTLRNG